MLFSTSMELSSVLTSILVGVVIVCIVILLDRVINKWLISPLKSLKRGDIVQLKLISRIGIIFVLLVILMYIYGQHLAALTLLVLTVIISLIGLRPIIEEYFTGQVMRFIDEYRIGLGDYVEINGIKGYVVKMTCLGIVVRNSRNELAHIPYTKLVKRVIKRIPAKEGVELQVKFKVPKETNIDLLKVKLTDYMMQLGVENAKVEVLSLDIDSTELIARGVFRDLRLIDDVKYKVLDKVWEIVSKGK